MKVTERLHKKDRCCFETLHLVYVHETAEPTALDSTERDAEGACDMAYMHTC